MKAIAALAALALVATLVALATPAAAGSGSRSWGAARIECHYVTGTNRVHCYAWADDRRTDGHCVYLYQRSLRSNAWKNRVRSCGPKTWAYWSHPRGEWPSSTVWVSRGPGGPFAAVRFSIYEPTAFP